MGDTLQAIHKASYQGDHPGNDPFRLIRIRDVAAIADAERLTPAQVEIMALEAGIVPTRYVRNMAAMDCRDQIRLLSSTAAVIGLGGLGGYAAQTLARSGVGRLVLIDGDAFEQTNLNRQNFCNNHTLGENKAEAAAEGIGAINPSVQVAFEGVCLDKDNAADILKGADVILDCLGGLDTRVILQKAAQRLGIPLVSAALAGFSGHVTTVYPGDQGLFPLMGMEEDSTGGGVELDLGCPCPPVSMAASLQCSEAIKVLTGKGQTLQNKILAFDLLDNTFQILNLA
ncbi:MAG: HesA/MoeB/ThiF family protein [Desulfatibacillum sp.]|nr:HesA/MoeB/ThiF family protein [Desulfatibacillum sp.]